MRPRCYNSVKDFRSLPCEYKSSIKGWMTSSILSQIVEEINLKMKSQNRKIILLIDNAGCHSPIQFESFSNVTVKFLPPNMTSVIQPLDAGIINAVKGRYRKKLVMVCIACPFVLFVLVEFHSILNDYRNFVFNAIQSNQYIAHTREDWKERGTKN